MKHLLQHGRHNKRTVRQHEWRITTKVGGEFVAASSEDGSLMVDSIEWHY